MPRTEKTHKHTLKLNSKLQVGRLRIGARRMVDQRCPCATLCQPHAGSPALTLGSMLLFHFIQRIIRVSFVLLRYLLLAMRIENIYPTNSNCEAWTTDIDTN